MNKCIYTICINGKNDKVKGNVYTVVKLKSKTLVKGRVRSWFHTFVHINCLSVTQLKLLAASGHCCCKQDILLLHCH